AFTAGGVTDRGAKSPDKSGAITRCPERKYPWSGRPSSFGGRSVSCADVAAVFTRCRRCGGFWCGGSCVVCRSRVGNARRSGGVVESTQRLDSGNGRGGG